ncbi:MAG: phage holin family protein [Pirellulales bacterium]|nr:phage holin family protein [Pirellulales bacterium]
MNANQGPLAGLGKELGALSAQLREAFTLRSELARLEIAADLRRARRLAIIWIIAGALLLAAFPLPAVAAAELLDGCGGVPNWGWLLIFSGGLFLIALAAVFLAWRRFRRRLALLRQTLEELREDFLWLREWCGMEEPAEETPRRGGSEG